MITIPHLVWFPMFRAVLKLRTVPWSIIRGKSPSEGKKRGNPVAVRLWKENEFKCYGLSPEKANSKTIATQSELVREERKGKEEKKVRYKREV